jgi:hypothetical protein
MSKAFHISDVLSAYSGYLVSTRHMAGVYEVLNFLTQDNLFTHQLPRAMDECKGWLKKQHPQLDNIDCAGLTPDTLPAWVEQVVAKYGETLEIKPLPKDAHEYRDPIEEAESMVGADRVIVIRGEDAQP